MQISATTVDCFNDQLFDKDMTDHMDINNLVLMDNLTERSFM